jgi:SUN family beta-glucosidase
MKFTLVAIFGATAVVAARSHRHVHRHADKHLGSPIEGRSPDLVTTVVPGPTETVYELNGKKLDPLEVAKGLAAGIYVLVSDTATSTSTSTSTTASTSSASVAAAEFYQKESTTSSSSTTSTTTSVAPPPSTSSTSTQAAATSAAPSSNQGGTGLDSSFPSGTIPCSTFPSAYGAVYIDYLGMSGWIGIQNVPNYKPGIDAAISYISAAVVGSNSACTANSYCSYACPGGYQKSQWPSAQGDVGQSIGGLYCNSEGMLELSRPDVKQLCVTGTGQVQVQSNLGAAISICRTDYPGTESETVPLQVNPNETHEITCPDATNYYMHEGSFTSAQYYINVQGVLPADACWWQTDSVTGPWHGSPGNIGNWAPVNMGVGKGSDGITFISLIPNLPTNPTGTLDYNIKITGDISGGCEYRNGQYYQDGNANPTGCTVSYMGK